MIDIDRAIRGTPIDNVRRYFLLHGWREVPTTGGAITLLSFGNSNDERVEVALPNRTDTPDGSRLIFEAITTISQIVDREVADLVDDINAIGFDRVRSTVPDEFVRFDSIELDLAENFIHGAKRLFAASASTELAPSAFFGRTAKEAQRYSDRCRFGHTFRGSFGFTIESPVPSNNEPSLSVFEQTAPFERRVIQRIARGFQSIQEAEIADDPAIIADNFNSGFNANMCEALADLIESTTDRLKFQFSWSPEWSPPEDIKRSHVYKVQPSTRSLVDDAAKTLRRADAIRHRVIIGQVVRLRSEHDPSDLSDTSSPREVSVNWLSDEFGSLTVKITLPPSDYIAAVEAHKSGRSVSIGGFLERIGRSWILSNPGQLSLI